jgi:hypothetical protein
MVGMTPLRPKTANRSRDDEFRESQLLEEDIPFIQDELDNVTNILYLIIEGVRNDQESFKLAQAKLRTCPEST